MNETEREEDQSFTNRSEEGDQVIGLLRALQKSLTELSNKVGQQDETITLLSNRQSILDNEATTYSVD